MAFIEIEKLVRGPETEESRVAEKADKVNLLDAVKAGDKYRPYLRVPILINTDHITTIELADPKEPVKACKAIISIRQGDRSVAYQVPHTLEELKSALPGSVAKVGNNDPVLC